MNQKSHQHSVRRIVLPSGRSIEVVRFPDGNAPAPAGLHVCPDCRSELVQPLDWAETPNHRWDLTLGCPNCGWCDHGVYDRDEIDRLEEKLDDGLAAMLDDLQRLTHANMAEEIERFVAALYADGILPEDF